MKRHFTATGFVVHDSRTLLLWNQNLGMWVPPGGHVEPDEDPVTTVLREIYEETALTAEIISLAKEMALSYPGQIQPPYTILLEDSTSYGHPAKSNHKHIDFIYFCRTVGCVDPISPTAQPMQWVDQDILHSRQPLQFISNDISTELAEDVRILGIEAIKMAEQIVSNKSIGLL